MGIVRTGLTKTVGQSNAQVVGGSLRFDSTQTQYLSRTPGSAGNRQTWTWSGWVKRNSFGVNNNIFSGVQDGNNGTVFYFDTNNCLAFFNYVSGGYAGRRVTTNVYRDSSSWYHILLVWDSTNATVSNRIRIYVNGIEVTTFSTNTDPSSANSIINSTNSNQIGADVGFNNGYSSLQISNAYFIDGQALDPSYFGFTDPLTNTWRPKKLKSGAATINDGRTWSSNYGNLRTAGTQTNPFDADNTNYAQVSVGGGGYFTFPDGLNGRLEVLASTGQSTDGASTQTVTISNNSGAVASRTTSKGYNTGPEAIDFGVVSGITSVFLTDSGLFWGFRINSITLRDGVTETIGFGTNGFWLPFDTDGVGTIGIGTDRSGRGNHWTTNNFVTTAAGIQTNPNIMPDSPSGISFSTAPTSGIGTTTGMTKPSNYATLNPLQLGGATYSGSQPNPLTNGNLDWSRGSGQSYGAVGNIPMVSGKYYWECTVTNVGDTNYGLGVIFQGATEQMRDGQASATYAGMYQSGGTVRKNGTSVATYATYTTGDVIGMGYNADTRDLLFYKNGVSQGTLALDAPTAPYVPWVFLYFNSTTSCSMNFGQKPFKFPPPSGFLPLCTANSPRPTIVRPDQYVGVTTYTGNGSTQSINVGFKPDLVWVKNRNGANNNVFQDSVRGFGSSKNLSSNQTQAEGVDTDGVITGVTNTGFNVDINAGSGNGTNRTNYTYVGWAWKAGGNSNTYNINDVGYATTTAAGLTGGTINPTGASVNTKSGFSIIKYTTPSSASSFSVPHGLTKKPNFAIFKSTASSGSWVVWHDYMGGNTGYLLLNTTDAFTSQTQTWGSSDPTSSVFNFGTTAWWGSSNQFIGYIWHDVSGFSKFGSYSGNGSTDGPAVITGFRPRWLLVKNASAGATDWKLYDAERNKYNPVTQVLYPNLSNSEDGNTGVDFLSNGFKWRDNGSSQNGSGNTIIYAAFAESPTQNLFGGQSNAR